MLKFATVALRLRYLIPATAVGGLYSAKRKYEDIKSQLPEMPEFLKDLYDTSKNTINSIDFNSWSASLNETTQAFNEARARKKSEELEIVKDELRKIKQENKDLKSSGGGDGSNSDDKSRELEKIKKELEKLRKDNEQLRNSTTGVSGPKTNNGEELIAVRRELERVKKENRELRSVVNRAAGSISTKRKLKKSLIEIYSEVLDELSGYDSSYKVQDHLPKVVVVGDQSSGKTSVLEMIAGARIFPRGAGEMMTRAPVQVTLCEGPYHIARFKDSSREYDLSKESELAELRKNIEDRMRQSVKGGKTVSNQVISLTIQGPGIQRMVLVDLPGIISTVTTDLAPDTKECIKNMVTEYMGNPNAIILCIQDGSIDAERSIFTDLVREVDKKGRRTIVVLTKVDIAEKTHANPTKIKKILDGELFPMKALGYYAVVAGKSGKNEDIQEIYDYEEKFFLTSALCRQGILNPSQCTIRNLGNKVAECFWGMVKASVEQQADAYQATLFNLEAEWNLLFPQLRQLTRDELFYNARNEILDDVAKLSRLPTKHWDVFISEQLWSRVKDHIIEQVYMSAASDPMHFSAKVDHKLQRWVESLELPKLAIEVARQSVCHQFEQILSQHQQRKGRSNGDDDGDDNSIYMDLKEDVIAEALSRHKWKAQALDVLKVVQLEALSKQLNLTKEEWNSAIDFLQSSLKESLDVASGELNELTGYSFAERWLNWKTTSAEQKTNSAIQRELDKLISSPSTSATSSPDSTSLFLANRVKLSEPELITVKRNLEAQGVEVDDARIQRVWEPFQRHAFLTSEVNRAQDCSKVFYFYENNLDSGTDCNHVLLFWRIKRMIAFTANSLRRQILEDECRRIEREIIDVLEEYGEDELKKVQLLSGKRVQLAEELRRVRQIQEKLGEFITALNQESV